MVIVKKTRATPKKIHGNTKSTGPFRRSRRKKTQPDRPCIALCAGFEMVSGYASNNESPAQTPSPVIDSDGGFFDNLFKEPVVNFANQVLSLQAYWQQIDSTNIYVEGRYTINRKTKTPVMRRGVYNGFWKFTKEFNDQHQPGFGIEYYHYKDSSVVRWIPQFFIDYPDHKLWITIASKNHMCALLVYKEDGVYKFFGYDPNLGHITQPLMNLINKIQSSRKTKEIRSWGARKANKDSTCVGLTWAFLTHVMIDFHDPIAKEGVRMKKDLVSFNTINMTIDDNKNNEYSSIAYKMVNGHISYLAYK